LEDDPGFRRQRERLRRLLQKVGLLLGESDTTLEGFAGDANAARMVQIDRLRVRLERAMRDYVSESAAFLDYVRERARKIDEANRKAAMTETRPAARRNEARIQKLSAELTRDLRLERVDAAIKELLDFLSDAEFFAANATTGRKRRLRALQKAIDQALEK
jgi:hypothetical protein